MKEGSIPPLAFVHPLMTEDELIALSDFIFPELLEICYPFGIFPWYENRPITWVYTYPRCVLFPSKLKIQKSMRSLVNGTKYKVSYNQEFDQVIRACSMIKREGQNGTWLSEELIQCMINLHQKGIAQSVEVWEDGELIGGLYGLIFGKIFFGESMFSYKSNASKFGFISLVQRLQELDFLLIDCQQSTDHIQKFGTEELSKLEFWKQLQENFKFILNQKQISL